MSKSSEHGYTVREHIGQGEVVDHASGLDLMAAVAKRRELVGDSMRHVWLQDETPGAELHPVDPRPVLAGWNGDNAQGEVSA